MAKRIVAIYDRGIDKNLMQGFDVLEKYGYELTLVEKTVNEDELAYQNSMLSVEVNGPDGTPINEEVFQYLDDAEIIITHFAPVSRRMIEAAKNLKIIATLRTGMENINMEAAKERGIKVINAPGRAAIAVADFTVAAMLCEIRNIARTDEDIKTGGWTKKYPNRTYSDNMCNLKVGLVGFGDIGRKIATRLKGFGTTILAYDPYCTKESIEAFGCVPVSLDELLEQADFVSLHVRLSPQTQNMFGAAEFAKMKPTAIFVNAARAGLVDEAAMIDALEQKLLAQNAQFKNWTCSEEMMKRTKDGKALYPHCLPADITGAVLDVFREEPLPVDHPLRKLKNVTLSAHLAGTDIGTFSGSIKIVADNLEQYFSGGELKNVVNH